MARRHSHPFFEFAYSSDGLKIQVTNEFGGFVANLKLKAVKAAIRQRTNRLLGVATPVARRIAQIYLAKFGNFVGRCLQRAIDTIATGFLILTIIVIAVPILEQFTSTPLARQFGITLTTEQIILIIDKIIDAIL